MKKSYLTLFLVLPGFLLSNGSASSQEKIDGSFAFQTEPMKQYSLYIPSNYVEGTPNQLVLALHPLHVVWGNAGTWRDILTDFAEANNLILAAPDGGPNGRIDDPIDKAFMTVLLDSVESWYTIDTNKEFILGFSWGGRATYSYGLENHNRFAGFLTIGSFINGTGGLGEALLTNALNQPFYIMHGDQDNTAPIATSFFPIRDELINRGAIVESLILQGVGHTIDFPNRDEIITTAYHWLDSVSTNIAVSVENNPELIPETPQLVQNYPNPFNPETKITYNLPNASDVELSIYNVTGQKIRSLINARQFSGNHDVDWNGLNDSGFQVSSGIYFYTLRADRFVEVKKMLLVR